MKVVAKIDQNRENKYLRDLSNLKLIIISFLIQFINLIALIEV